jgi:two-component system, cell cycle response regulator DivK
MSKLHALIIDDNKDNLGILAQLLSLEGVSHTGINNPARVKDALTQLERVDIVFLDLEMPGIDGYNVLKMLKADARFKTVPVVAYTVHVSEINTARQLGFHSFLGKPLDADRFPEQLARILRGEHVWVTA